MSMKFKSFFVSNISFHLAFNSDRLIGIRLLTLLLLLLDNLVSSHASV